MILYSGPMSLFTGKVRIALDVQSRHDGPRFARFELLQAALERSAGRANERADLGRQVPRRADAQTLDRVDQHVAKLGVVKDFFFEHQQRSR